MRVKSQIPLVVMPMNVRKDKWTKENVKRKSTWKRIIKREKERENMEKTEKFSIKVLIYN